LIGALGLAVILLGLAVVFNSVVLAGEASDAGAASEIEQMNVYNKQIRKDVRTLAVHTNHRTVYATESALNDSLRRNTSKYGRLLSTTYAAERGVHANVTFVRRNETGVRIVQTDDREFRDSGNTPDWTPVGAGSPSDYPGESDLGWFVMNVNASATSDQTQDSFTVFIEGSDGENATIKMDQNTSTEGVETALNVRANTSTGASESVVCLASGDRVLVDMLDGRCVNDQAKTFETVEDLEAPYLVEFKNGGEGVGKYAVVADEHMSTGSYTCSGSVSPCTTPAAWSIKIGVVYQSENGVYSNSQNVSIYGGRS
jgi:hypothetical protein